MWSSRKASLVLLVGLIAHICSSTSYRNGNDRIPTIKTSSGQIVGHKAANVSDVWEFLGIPYAKPPVGPLRFSAPQALRNAGSRIIASNWSPDCPATLAPVSKFPNFTGNGFKIQNTFTGHVGNPQSEDCLALNVWSKGPSASFNSDRKKPVLLFLHGGRFAIPGPHNPFYYGQYLACAEDLVVVTVNYRLGIFGFPGGPTLTQNVGLLDQRLAIEWVRDNIAGFGGDKSRIILMGQSAGASSAGYYSYQYVKDPIVAGIIAHSGTALSFLPNNQTYSESIFFNVSGTLGCGGATTRPANAIACIRSKPFVQVLAAAAKAPAIPPPAGLPQPPFQPTVDGITVFDYATYLFKSANGQFARVPLLTGNNKNEDGTYRVNAFAANITLTDSQWKAFDLAAFVCPSSTEARNRALYGVPTWRWVYYGDWDNLRLYRNSKTYHGSELTLVFGTTEIVTGDQNSRTEAIVGYEFMAAWAAFARDPQRGLSSRGLPRYDPKKATLIQIALDNSRSIKLASPYVEDADCPARNNPIAGWGAF